MTFVLKINYPRFAEKNETDDFVQNNMCECLFTMLTNVYFFYFLVCLVCSHLDGIFVKKNSLISIMAFVLLFFSHQLLA